MSRTSEAARGKWKGILLELGAPAQALSGKHGPCPFCGGKDRFRWDNKAGAGSFICNDCGAGDGMEFAKRLLGCDFRAAAKRVDEIVGSVRPEPAKPPTDERKRKADLNQLWKSGAPIAGGDPVARYLDMRRLPFPQNADCLRFVQSCPVPGEAGGRLAMVAMVTGPDGAPATLHRTFLAPDGRKAAMDQPRALMPGPVPDGAAIRLASVQGERLGVAEGIETALAAMQRFGLPVWATISSAILAKWTPPEGVREVVVFGDCDDAFGGQAAAYALAHRLRTRFKLDVEVRIPATLGKDWADADAS